MRSAAITTHGAGCVELRTVRCRLDNVWRSMSYIQLTDKDLIEAFYASNILRARSHGDDPVEVLDALRNASQAERCEIASECAAKAVDVAIGLCGTDEAMGDPGFVSEWVEILEGVAAQLRIPPQPRNRVRRGNVL